MKKAALVILVLAIGVGGAILFRKPSQGTSRPVNNQRAGAPSVAAELATDDRGSEDAVPSGVPLDNPYSATRPIASDIGVPGRPSAADDHRNEDSLASDEPPRSPPVQPPTLGRSRPPLPKLSNFENSTGSVSEPPKFDPPSNDETSKASSAERPVAEKELRNHRIVDGDTLERIARRYLGSATRANEILLLNRDVLREATVLPLGATIKIPPRWMSANSPSGRPLPVTDSAPARPAGASPDLVPLPRE